MTEFQFRPIVTWPGPLTPKRKRAAFRAGYNDTLRLLRHELGRLGASNVVIQLAVAERDIRQDGLPRGDMRPPQHPGVVLSFDSKHGPLSYPCDTYSDWQDNMRAIALALESLRAVDRYGVTRRAEQYRGWAQLPYIADVAMTREQALGFLANHAPLVSGSKGPTEEAIKEAYRAAALKLHPDRNGGDDAPFKRLQEAKRVLRIGG